MRTCSSGARPRAQAIYGVSALFGAGTALAGMEARALTPTFYQWIYGLYPDIPAKINKDYAKTHKLDAKIAPVQGFGIDRFVAEAKKKKSTWDVYVGMTPFVEMAALIESGHDRAVGQVHPEVGARRPDPVDPGGGDLPGPHLVVPVPARHHHPGLERRARRRRQGSTRTRPRRPGIEFIANAKKVVSSKAAPYGAVFDAHGWRSLAPIAHTFSTNVYTPAGLFDFTSDAAVNALEIMKRLMEVAPKNILEEGKVDGGVNTTPDEEAFAARQAAYYVKYQNAPTRFAGTWPDPKVLHIAGLPKARSGGGTVFWNTGAALFKYGENKQQAADYMEFLTWDMRIWQHALGKDVRGASGQLSPYRSRLGEVGEEPAVLDGRLGVHGAQGARDEQGDPDAQVRPDPVRDRQAGLGGVPEGRREEREEGAREGEGPRAGRGEEERKW